MRDDELAPLLNDPDLSTAQACLALLELARRAAPREPDIAGDVVLILTERLLPGQTLRTKLGTHPNPEALLNVSAANAANQARAAAGREKRRMPLTPYGTLDELEPDQYPYTPTMGIFDVLHDLGWTTELLESLAVPRKRPGRSIHPGIEDALERLATCYGVTVRCHGCPTPMELQRMSLLGPADWPALVPVLAEWDWSDALIEFITTRPVNIAHWRDLGVTPPPRQERRMVEVARKMRWEPWLLTDPQVIRDGVLSKRVRPTDPPAPAAATIDCAAHPTVLRLPLEAARR